MVKDELTGYKVWNTPMGLKTSPMVFQASMEKDAKNGMAEGWQIPIDQLGETNAKDDKIKAPDWVSPAEGIKAGKEAGKQDVD